MADVVNRLPVELPATIRRTPNATTAGILVDQVITNVLTYRISHQPGLDILVALANIDRVARGVFPDPVKARDRAGLDRNLVRN
jgi:hypothetical protein